MKLDPKIAQELIEAARVLIGNQFSSDELHRLWLAVNAAERAIKLDVPHFDPYKALMQLEDMGVVTNVVVTDDKQWKVLLANAGQVDIDTETLHTLWLGAMAQFTALARRFKMTYEDGLQGRPTDIDVQMLVQYIREMQ